MNNNNWQKIFYRLFFVAVILFTSRQNIFSVLPASADAAPPAPPGGSDLSPNSEMTNVRMESEKVVIEVSENSEYAAGQATVTANFFMLNMGETTENMVVRFPLNFSEFDLLDNRCDYSQFPPVEDLHVWVDEQAVEITKTLVTMPNPMAGEGTPPTVTVPCWAHFPVSFPPNQRVAISVKYFVSGYPGSGVLSNVEYYYVLETGAGWKGTIGEANIIMRFPYEINPMNFVGCRLGIECSPKGQEILWHFEDFEPDRNIGVEIMLPSVWKKILRETENTEANPKDGEAWGRLGRAYKQAIMARRGFRYDTASAEMYELSQEAYQNAINLLPNDADWHYGFAELLCTSAMWGGDGTIMLPEGGTFPVASWKSCVEQLKQTLVHLGIKGSLVV